MNDALQIGRALEIKRTSATAEGSFSGLAATFGGSPDRVGDVIKAGAFAQSLLEHRQHGTSPGLLWSHLMTEPIGRWTELAEDATGLRVTGQLTMQLQRSKDAIELMRDGVLSLSIGFRTRGDKFENGHRVLSEIDLLEISLVAVPANPRATITAVKDLRGPADLQRILQEIGFSQREAKRIVAGGWRALRSDSNSTELSHVAALLRAHAAKLTST